VNEEYNQDMIFTEMPFHEIVKALYNRNIYMIDNCDALLSVWSGKESGGTLHAINYARKNNKQIINVNSFTLEISKI